MLVSIGCNDTVKGSDVTDVYDVTIQCTMYIPYGHFLSMKFSHILS